MFSIYCRHTLCFISIANYLKNTLSSERPRKQQLREVRSLVAKLKAWVESKPRTRHAHPLLCSTVLVPVNHEDGRASHPCNCIKSSTLPEPRVISSQDPLEAASAASTRHKSGVSPPNHCLQAEQAQMRSLEEAIMILLHPLC